MQADPLLEKLHAYGHFQGRVTQAELDGLRRDDTEAVEAIRSYQGFFQDILDDLCLKHHHRAKCCPDGHLGPATAELIELPRCGVPDYGMEESANWPASCRDLKTGYSMQLPGLSDGELRRLWLQALGNWTGSLADLDMRLESGSDPLTYDIHATGSRLPGSTLAWSHLARNRCDVTLEQRYDTSIQWSSRLFVTTASHELGHALGFGHLRNSQALMFPQITSASQAREGFPHQSDLRQARDNGYLVAADPQPAPPEPEPPPPAPEPVPPMDTITVAGQIAVKVGPRLKLFKIIPDE